MFSEFCKLLFFHNILLLNSLICLFVSYLLKLLTPPYPPPPHTHTQQQQQQQQRNNNIKDTKNEIFKKKTR